METFNTFSNAAAEKKVESFGDTEVKVNFKALNYKMVDRQRKVKVGKPGYTSQRRKWCTCEYTG